LTLKDSTQGKPARRASTARRKPKGDEFSQAPALLTILRDYALPSFAILGPIVYAVLRLAYFFFYQRLRTTPEEVGYGYTRILAESVVGTVELLVLVFLLVLSLRLCGRVLRRAFPGVSRWWPGGLRKGRGAGRPKTERAAFQALAIAAGLVVLIYPLLGWHQGNLARRGVTVRNVYFVGLPYLPVLAVQAVPARVAWLNPAAEVSFSLAERDCLLYLGSSGAVEGTSVFYDVRNRDSVRLPSSQISVTLLYSFSSPPSCKEGGA
jgi:hypothetical protein